MNRALLLTLFALPLLAQAKVYRWVDARGQVHYSQTPPPELGAKPTEIHTVPAAPPPATKPAPAKLPAAVAPMVDEKAERAARAKHCDEARERITYLEEKAARRLGIEQPDGTLSRMTEEEFQERLSTAHLEERKHCSP